MGRIVKQINEDVTRYYWYPGDKKEWIRAAVALGVGLVMALTVGLLWDSGLGAAVAGTSATAAVAGVNFGRRDARALAGFPDMSARAARRAAVVHTGRAAWRGIVEGLGGAAFAVIVVSLPHRGVVADVLLPLVPAVVGALAHQAGMLYERVATIPVETPAPAGAAAATPAVAATPAAATPASTEVEPVPA
jgi:hypothetical protein